MVVLACLGKRRKHRQSKNLALSCLIQTLNVNPTLLVFRKMMSSAFFVGLAMKLFRRIKLGQPLVLHLQLDLLLSLLCLRPCASDVLLRFS